MDFISTMHLGTQLKSEMFYHKMDNFVYLLALGSENAFFPHSNFSELHTLERDRVRSRLLSTYFKLEVYTIIETAKSIINNQATTMKSFFFKFLMEEISTKICSTKKSSRSIQNQ